MTGTLAAATFEFAPLQIAPGLASAGLYARRCATLAGTPRAVPRERQVAFYAGVAVILTVLVSPLAGLSDELFWAHMVEHLVIADLGALLIVLGLTGPLLAPVLRIPVFDRLRVLAHPLVALPLWAIDLYAWHVPVLHVAAVHHDGLHALQHLCFIFFGANVWMCLFGPLPMPSWFGTGWKAGYILGVRLVGAALANALLFGGGAFYHVYAAGEAAHGISAEGDQVVAGSVMMVEESLLTIGLFCWLFLRAARQSDERQELLDLAAARGVDLTPERAARAVAAGRAGELRARIERGPGAGPTPQA
ncbi:cytochrome c oxidase assembly protein [Baekduia soli]|uniref:Cytochrome c oxidase assembly protein n=1 Tax=Baekduia soli TaxID=496014 RepID=A0A5B8U2H6_9ACTN|nr:cytochrome c oxidase assembly protein [Baekduia soli]QEC47173.1 cytochrome c oxidase assembly protein [Baekduia soli]